jgi:hypothetical protein
VLEHPPALHAHLGHTLIVSESLHLTS